MLSELNARRRVPVSVSEIVLGRNCGGSDGSSGITANPALSGAPDRLVSLGGTSLLAETPKVFGAEHLLTHRAVTSEVGRRLLRVRSQTTMPLVIGEVFNTVYRTSSPSS